MKKKSLASLLTSLGAIQTWALGLSKVFREKSDASLYSFGISEGARMGSAVLGGATLDLAVARPIEKKLKIPERARGLIPLAAYTLGVAATIKYFGNYFGFQEGENFLDTANTIVYQYGKNLGKLKDLNVYAHSLFTLGGSSALTAAGRLVYNNIRGILRDTDPFEKELFD